VKKPKKKYCPWCGTWLRGRVWPDCPRGPFCKVESDNHDDLMHIIEAEAKK